MSSMASTAPAKPCVAKAFGAQRPLSGRTATIRQGNNFASQTRHSPLQREGSAFLQQRSQRAVQTAVAQELYQVADVGSFVGGTAATMFAMTLVGLAIGFVLLRFEALVEEGKI